MSFESTNKQIYNANAKKTTDLLKTLDALYKELLKKIKDELAIYRERSIEDPVSPAFQARRLLVLQQLIKDEIAKLLILQNNIIKKNVLDTELNTYYATAFNIEREINTMLDLDFSYSINYPFFDMDFARDEFSAPLGGITEAERNKSDKAILINAAIGALTFAAVAGLTSDEIRQRLKPIGNLIDRAKSKAIMKGRQLMFNAYSQGDEYSVIIAEKAGVSGFHTWASTLDAKTRPAGGVSPPPNHRTMDGRKRDIKTELFKFDSGETIRAPRIIGKGTATGRQIFGCRCRRLFKPGGVTPTKRGSRTAEGDWVEVNGDLTYTEWADTLEGKRTLESAIK